GASVEVGTYWRGVFSHKQGLGVFAGLTSGLLLFYGRAAFSSALARIAALLCSLACLLGSGSATGMLTLIVTTLSLYASCRIAKIEKHGTRRLCTDAFLATIFIVYFLWSSGALGFIPSMFGKSDDLSSRTEYWSVAMNVFRGSGSTLFGGGYAVGF